MPSSIKVGNLPVALEERLFPSVTTWNRLEARPRTQQFERALQAEVRDALWMLTKQWQMGEFRGSDAGSPVFSKLLLDTTRLTKYQPDAKPTQPFEEDVPLEAKVERYPIELERQNRPMSIDLRMAMGRQWLRLIAGFPPAYRKAFVDTYGFVSPDPTKKENADVCAQPEVFQTLVALSVISGRAMDGGGLYLHLIASAGNRAYDDVAGIAPGDFPELNKRADRFVAWFQRLFFQPPSAADSAWMPSKLEYNFAVSAPTKTGGEKVYVADEYSAGRLDWYSVDVNAASSSLDPVDGASVTGLPADGPRTMIPTPVSFSGMPNTRWWSFEDRKTNFGDIDANTTDVAKLLFIEFALVYSNDWFVIPYTLPAGAIATIKGFAVTNVFGERLWIEAAGSGADANWQRWSMFTINVEGLANAAAENSLLLLPTLGKVQQGPPGEEIMLVRDEVANMVWGIEKTVPLPTGVSRPGKEVAAQNLAFLQNLIAPPAPSPGLSTATIRYQVMSTVPEHWIPFIPVHVPGSNRTIQIQRAALPRTLAGDPNPPAKVQPRTALLREGLDKGALYFIHEEEVPRAGARLLQFYQRTRWTDGKIYTWLRVLKQTGRGEGSSGLAFDEIVDQSPSK
jgi:hypothetical protein